MSEQQKASMRRTLVAIGIVLAAIIMAASILLPSLSAIVSGLSSSDTSDDTSAVTEEAETSDTLTSYIESIDERYSATAESLLSKVEADSSDKASLINLANTYYEWGATVNTVASTDEQQEHVTELLNSGIEYYDRYLALEDSNAAKVNRALCQYYLNNSDEAIAELNEVCANDATYAPAWSYLGMIYSALGDTESALKAYNAVVDVDPQDTYGLKSSAQSKISSLSESSEEATTEEATTETQTTE